MVVPLVSISHLSVKPFTVILKTLSTSHFRGDWLYGKITLSLFKEPRWHQARKAYEYGNVEMKFLSSAVRRSKAIWSVNVILQTVKGPELGPYTSFMVNTVLFLFFDVYTDWITSIKAIITISPYYGERLWFCEDDPWSCHRLRWGWVKLHNLFILWFNFSLRLVTWLRWLARKQ